jgi:hypothetical protein
MKLGVKHCANIPVRIRNRMPVPYEERFVGARFKPAPT